MAVTSAWRFFVRTDAVMRSKSLRARTVFGSGDSAKARMAGVATATLASSSRWYAAQPWARLALAEGRVWVPPWLVAIVVRLLASVRVLAIAIWVQATIDRCARHCRAT